MNRPKSQRTTELLRVGPKSQDTFARAQAVFPDGTARVTIERDPTPRYVERGIGSYLFDIDGRRFLDLNCNFTTLIHGHAFAPVIESVTRQLQSGSCFANPTEIEIALAELLCGRIPNLERIRFANTGTEAVLFAVKAARPARSSVDGSATAERVSTFGDFAFIQRILTDQPAFRDQETNGGWAKWT